MHRINGDSGGHTSALNHRGHSLGQVDEKESGFLGGEELILGAYAQNQCMSNLCDHLPTVQQE